MINRFKNWMLSWGFIEGEVSRRTNIEVRSYIEEAQEQSKITATAERVSRSTMETLDETIRQKSEEKAREKLEALLSIIDERHIVTFDKNMRAVYIGGVKADEGQLGNLRSEAEMILSTNLWQILHHSPKKLAERAMFVDDGILPNQLLKGRSILYMLDTQARIIETFKSYTPPKKDATK